MFGGVTPRVNAQKMNAEVIRRIEKVGFGLPGVAPDSPLFEPQRYCLSDNQLANNYQT